MSLKQVTANPL